MSGTGGKIPDDKFTGEWYRTQFSGQSSLLFKLAAENAQLEKKWAALHERYKEIDLDNVAIRSRIGEICDKHEAFVISSTEKLEDFSSKYWELKNRYETLEKKHAALVEYLRKNFPDKFPPQPQNGAAT